MVEDTYTTNADLIRDLTNEAKVTGGMSGVVMRRAAERLDTLTSRLGDGVTAEVVRFLHQLDATGEVNVERLRRVVNSNG